MNTQEVTMNHVFKAKPCGKGRLFKSLVINLTTLLPGTDLDLLLIGKTGHGKSSTGNAILGCEKFKVSANCESVTAKCERGWARFDDRNFKVVDCPGVCDTKKGNDEIAKAISAGIANCAEGFHALLLVIRFGQRMTGEEIQAINLLKDMFGKNIVKDYCICIVTYGDDFKKQVQEGTFEAWCKGQGGYLKELFEECQYRCVLFDNVSENSYTKNRQRALLVSSIDKLTINCRYTNEMFQAAMKAKEEAMKKENISQFDEQLLVLSNLTMSALSESHTNDNISQNASNSIGYVRNQLETMLPKLEGTPSGKKAKNLFDLTGNMLENSDPETVEKEMFGLEVFVETMESVFRAIAPRVIIDILAPVGRAIKRHLLRHL